MNEQQGVKTSEFIEMLEGLVTGAPQRALRRDQFAMAALQGVLAGRQTHPMVPGGYFADTTDLVVAYADATLAALDAKKAEATSWSGIDGYATAPISPDVMRRVLHEGSWAEAQMPRTALDLAARELADECFKIHSAAQSGGEASVKGYIEALNRYLIVRAVGGDEPAAPPKDALVEELVAAVSGLKCQRDDAMFFGWTQPERNRVGAAVRAIYARAKGPVTP